MPQKSKWSLVVIRAVPLFVLLTLCCSPTAFSQEQQGEGFSAVESAGEKQDDCVEFIKLLEARDEKISRELHQIKRDIAALNQNLEQPGFGEAMAGVGYIFGFLGIAAFFLSRRKTDSRKTGK
ncbi:MAG: hypothetical protein V1706_01415 [Pseudomonadota bacterium]